MEQMENKRPQNNQIAALKARLATLDGACGRTTVSAESTGALPLPLAHRTLHDLYAATPADAVATNAFGLGLAVEAAAGRPIVWGLHEMMAQETGRPHAPGLNEMGLRPRDLLLVRARDIQTLLAIGEEALRSPAVGAVLLSGWGEAKALTLTASRRLALAAQAGEATLFLARAAAEPAPSAAQTRWSVRAAASTPLEANAPGRPAFSATRLRHRGGGAPGTWIMEWDRERRVFVEPDLGGASLPGGLVPLVAQRPAEAGGGGALRRVA